MAFSFRRSARLGPLRLHVARSGISSISSEGRIGGTTAGLLRARSHDDAKRRAQRGIQAVEEARRLAGLP